MRAGVLEQGTVDVLEECGAGERMRREGLVHRGIELRFDGRGHRIDFPELTGGRSIMVYGQQELVKDLVRLRLAAGGRNLFEVDDVGVHDIESNAPRVRFLHGGEMVDLACRIVAGCDGFHGVCRETIPAGVLSFYERVYPFAWLGILAQAPPPSDELIYSAHESGFALYSMRSPAVSRLYLQVAPDEDPANWPDARIWGELRRRLGDDDGVAARGRTHSGEARYRDAQLRRRAHAVRKALSCGRCRAHRSADGRERPQHRGRRRARARAGDRGVLHVGQRDAAEAYSQTCLKRVWRAERFSWWMTSMLHRFPEHDGFQHRLQRSELDYLVSSRAAAASLAENYVGLPFDW